MNLRRLPSGRPDCAASSIKLAFTNNPDTVPSIESVWIVDQNGKSTSVPKVQLPFIVGGHDGDQDHDFLMTALGPSTEGILHDPPVTLYLKLDGSEVSIESIEVHQ